MNAARWERLEELERFNQRRPLDLIELDQRDALVAEVRRLYPETHHSHGDTIARLEGAYAHTGLPHNGTPLYRDNRRRQPTYLLELHRRGLTILQGCRFDDPAGTITRALRVLQ